MRVLWARKVNKTDWLQVKLIFFQRSKSEMEGRYRKGRRKGELEAGGGKKRRGKTE